MTQLGTQSQWIRRFHESTQCRSRLICFPHAGGSASYYFPLSQALAPGIEVLAVQYPGRQDRRTEPLIDDLHTLADHALTSLSTWTDRPYAFFGHSMGALVAFEVARRLETQSGAGPLRLFVSGRRAPSRHRDRPAQPVHQLDDPGLIAEMRRVGGTDPRLLQDPELLQAILPVTRNDYRAVETYRWSPGPPLRTDLTVLTGDDDPQTTAAEAAAWQEHSSGDFDLVTLPGGHFFLEAHRDRIAQKIAVALAAHSLSERD